jgi:hypothetical protein
MMRDTLTDKKVVEELTIDISAYEQHTDCEVLRRVSLTTET